MILEVTMWRKYMSQYGTEEIQNHMLYVIRFFKANLETTRILVTYQWYDFLQHKWLDTIRFTYNAI